MCDLLNIGECPENLKNLGTKTKTKIIEETDNYDINENAAAFEYYSNKKNYHKTKSNSKQGLSPSDPVRLLQEAGKRFGLKNLCKKLDNLVYGNGYIQEKSGKLNLLTEKLIFDRAFNNMHDVVIKTTDNKEILGHRCILSARLEYFNNIFAVRWNLVS